MKQLTRENTEYKTRAVMAENNEKMLKTKLTNQKMGEKLREARANDIIEDNKIL